MIKTFEQIYNEVNSEKENRERSLSHKRSRGKISDFEYEKAKQNLDRWAERTAEKKFQAAQALENDDNVKLFVTKHSSTGGFGIPGIEWEVYEGKLSDMKKWLLNREDKPEEVYDDKTLVKALRKKTKREMEQFYKTRNAGFDPGYWHEYDLFTEKKIEGKTEGRKSTGYYESIIVTDYGFAKSPF